MRLSAVLDGQPDHATDALEDLEAVTRRWPPELRCALIDRVCAFAEEGWPLPAALIRSLGELLGEEGP